MKSLIELYSPSAVYTGICYIRYVGISFLLYRETSGDENLPRKKAMRRTYLTCGSLSLRSELNCARTRGNWLMGRAKGLYSRFFAELGFEFSGTRLVSWKISCYEYRGIALSWKYRVVYYCYICQDFITLCAFIEI